MSTHLSLRCDAEMSRRIKALADAHGLTRSQVARDLLRRQLEIGDSSYDRGFYEGMTAGRAEFERRVHAE